MQVHSHQTAQDRLSRLERYLKSDPDNASLLIDAFETALACSEFDRAELHLRHGLALSHNDWSWRLKEGDFWLARRELDRAATVLQALRDDPMAPQDLLPVLVHNLAYVDMQAGEFARCVQRLRPYLDPANSAADSVDTVLVAALQLLWVRALHRLEEHSQVLDWARDNEAAGLLTPSAAGAASLVAFDEDIPSLAHAWSTRALTQGLKNDRPIEALTVQASLALGRRDAKTAKQLGGHALLLQPADGRSMSILGFANVLEGHLEAACGHFVQALNHMPGHIGTWHGLAWARIGLGELEEAHQAFDRALSLDRNFADSHGGMAVVHALRNEVETTRKFIETALRLDRSCVSAKFAEALLQGSSEDIERLKAMIERAVLRYFTTVEW